MTSVLTTLENELLGHLFGAHCGTAIRSWAEAEIQSVLQKNSAATLAEVQGCVNATIPVLIGHLTAVLPIFLRPFAANLEAYATSAADSFIAAEYSRLAARIAA